MNVLYNPELIATTFACFFIAIFLLYKIQRKHEFGNKRYHPIAGTVIHQLINFDRLHHYMTDLAGKYRTYRLIGPCRNEIYTSEPANVEYILKTNFENYAKVCSTFFVLREFTPCFSI